MKYCQHCNAEFEEELTRCPSCGAQQEIPAAAADLAQDETVEIAAGGDAVQAATTEHVALESMELSAAEQQQAELGNHQKTKVQKRKRKKLLIALLAFVLAVVLFFGGGMLYVWLDANKRVTEAREKIQQVLQGDLAAMLQNGEAQTYGYYIQKDEALGIETYRALLPNGWMATLKENISWNFASAADPATYTLSAYSPDDLARLYTISPVTFVENSLDEPTIAQGKLALNSETENAKSFTLWFLGMTLPMKDFNIRETKNLDTKKTLLKQYAASLSAVKEDAKAQGLSVSDIYFDVTELSGSCTLNGTDAVGDMRARIALCGYTLTKGTGAKAETVKVWRAPMIQFYYAPLGKLGDYAADMDFIVANQSVNQNWLAACNRASAAAIDMISRKEAADWVALAEKDNKLLSAAKKDLKTETDYRIPADTLGIDSFAQLMFDLVPYKTAEGLQARMPKDFSKVFWTLQEQNIIYLGVKPADYKPGGGYSWTELTK